MKPLRAFRILIDWTAEDVRDGLRNFVRNSIAASYLTPRILRFAIYRALGVRVRTPNILSHLKIEGPSSNLSVGSGTFVNRNCTFECMAPVSVGDHCLVGMEVLLVTSDHERTSGGFLMTPAPQPVRIGSRVWIGARAIILPGVIVHDDVIIAAGSVVTKDCESHGIYGGVPARRLKEQVPR